MKVFYAALIILITGIISMVVWKSEEIAERLFHTSNGQTQNLLGEFGDIPTGLQAQADEDMHFPFEPAPSSALSDAAVRAAVQGAFEHFERADFDFASYQAIVDDPKRALATVEGETFAELFASRPFTEDLYNLLHEDIAVLIAREQIRYSVPQMVHMDTRIEPKLSLPEVPSYPSMEAAELYLLHGLFDYLAPATGLTDHTPSEVQVEPLLASGVTMQMSIDRSRDIVATYLEYVFGNAERVADVLPLIQAREWSNKFEPAALPAYQYDLDYAIAASSSYAFDGRGVLFKASLEPYRVPGVEHQPQVLLEIDRYADGGQNYLAEIPVFENLTTLDHYEPYKVSGTHRYRYVVLPATETRETNYLNNIGFWHKLIIP